MAKRIGATKQRVTTVGIQIGTLEPLVGDMWNTLHQVTTRFVIL